MAPQKVQAADPRRAGRMSFRDTFLAKLRLLSANGTNVVNNRTLIESLGWESERFNTTRNQLIQENLIVPTRGGPGGATALTGVVEDRPVSMFISYSKIDEEMKDELVKHLHPLKRLNIVSAWDFRDLVPGQNWGNEISTRLTSASIILLLVSADFINSEYCYDIEMETALLRAEKGECNVIPVLLRNCLWSHAPFAKLQGLPKNMRAVNSWPSRDDAYVDIAEGIKDIAEAIILKRGAI